MGNTSTTSYPGKAGKVGSRVEIKHLSSAIFYTSPGEGRLETMLGSQSNPLMLLDDTLVKQGNHTYILTQCGWTVKHDDGGNAVSQVVPLAQSTWTSQCCVPPPPARTEVDYLCKSAHVRNKASRSITGNELDIAVPALVKDKNCYWNKGRTLKVCFLWVKHNDPRNALVMHITKEWSKYANIHFEQIRTLDGSDIRVSYGGLEAHAQSFTKWDRPQCKCDGLHFGQQASNKDAAWSRVGTNAELSVGSPTMNLGFACFRTNGQEPASIDMQEFRRTVLHEFGHAIGLHHEQLISGIPFDLSALMLRHQSCFETQQQCEAWVRLNYFNQVPDGTTGWKAWANLERVDNKYDPRSIMHYPVTEDMLDPTLSTAEKNKWIVGWNSELSEQDKKLVAKLYPYS